MRFTHFILLTLTLLACTEEKKRTRVLPMLGNYDLEYKTIDGEKIVDTLFHKIPVFTFLNEDSILKTNSDFCVEQVALGLVNAAGHADNDFIRYLANHFAGFLVGHRYHRAVQ